MLAGMGILLLAANAPARTNNERDKRPYAVSNIPASFRDNAGAVVRTISHTFEVKNEKRAVETYSQAVTVFKREDRDNGVLLIHYDKFLEIDDLEGKLYDADGNEIRELEKSDTKDHAEFSEYSLFDDARIREANLYYDHYPYTVEFTYTILYKGYLNWPTWHSRLSRDPVERSTFTVTIPEEDSLRFWCNRDTIPPRVTKESGKNVYRWSAANQPYVAREAIGDDLEDYAMVVRIAPSKFEIAGTSGDMQSWKNFGQWCYNLYEGRDKLPAQAVQDIHALVLPSDGPIEKIHKVYTYMQGRTRYVSVQLGIGGWQPFEASYVQERGYGDCKALSNYTIALLKEVGVTAYPVLVRIGDFRITFIPEFPSNQFNHVIVCVPLQPDTVWLECTSQNIPFGHLSSDVENRGALMLTPGGGTPVQIPATVPSQNTQTRSGTVYIDFFGDATGRTSVTYEGDQQDRISAALQDQSPQDRLLWAIRSLDLPNAKLNGFKLNGLEQHSPSITVSTEFAVPRFASASATRLFFLPNAMERRTWVPPEIPRRLSPIYFVYPYHDVDSILYILPYGFTTEATPSPMEVHSSFGTFLEKSVALGDTAVRFIRSLEIHEYSIPSSGYEEYRKFFYDVVRADRAQVVLVKKSN